MIWIRVYFVSLLFSLHAGVCTIASTSVGYTHVLRQIKIHTCSEVKGGSGGVGGEEKMSKMCVFRGPVSHYIGV